MPLDPELEKKLNDVFQQWEADDATNAADSSESAADTNALTDPTTWTEQDGIAKDKLRLRQAVDSVQPEAPADDSEPTPEAGHGAAQLATEAAQSAAPKSHWQEMAEQLGAKPVKSTAMMPELTKTGSKPGPDWKALEDNLFNAQFRAQGSRAAEQMFANVSPGGYRTDPGRFEAQVEAAKLPMEMAQQKQVFERNQQQLDTSKAQAKASAEARDPNSSQSQRAREALKTFFKGTDLPPSIDSWSAAEVNAFIKDPLLDLAKLRNTQEVAGTKAKLAAGEKQKALDDRKKLMLSLYPDHKPEIEGLTDLGNAQTLQTALQGEAGRKETQQHQDEAAETTRKHEDEMLVRREGFEKEMKDYEMTHRPLTADQANQLEGLNKADGLIDSFEKRLGDVSTLGGKIGAATGPLGGALGLKGANFEAEREGAAVGLARSIEGGVARPGTVEVIKHILPLPSDADGVKRSKMQQIRDLVQDTREGFVKALKQGGFRPLQGDLPEAGPKQAQPPSQQPAAKSVKMKFPDGSVQDVPPEKVEKAKQKGGKVFNG